MQAQESTLLNDSKYKIVILGQSNVGKTSIVQYITNGTFSNNSDPTLYLDSVRKNVVFNGRVFKLTFWDTAGQQKFNSLVPSAIRGAQCALIVFDVTDKHSFEKCQHWMNMLRASNNSSSCPSILVGNKNDLVSVVTKTEAFDYAIANGMSYIETSAKSGYGFQNLLCQIIQNIQSKLQRSTKSSEQLPKKPLAGPKLKQNKIVQLKTNKNCCSI